MPEILGYMEHMRRIIRKYDKIIKHYYVQYLSDYDALVLMDCIKVGLHKRKYNDKDLHHPFVKVS